MRILYRTTLSATIQHDSTLLNALCDEDVEDMLSPECELLPPDLTKRCARSSREHRDLNALQTETDAIERLVSEKEASLHKHQAKPSKHGGVVTVTDVNDRSNRIHLARTVAVHAETMSQLVESFIRSCSTELRDLMKARPLGQQNGILYRRRKCFGGWVEFISFEACKPGLRNLVPGLHTCFHQI